MLTMLRDFVVFGVSLLSAAAAAASFPLSLSPLPCPLLALSLVSRSLGLIAFSKNDKNAQKCTPRIGEKNLIQKNRSCSRRHHSLGPTPAVALLPLETDFLGSHKCGDR